MLGCPWGDYAIIMLERAVELTCRAIRNWRIVWGRVQAQQPAPEVLSAKWTGQTTIPDMTAVRRWSYELLSLRVKANSVLDTLVMTVSFNITVQWKVLTENHS